MTIAAAASSIDNAITTPLLSLSNIGKSYVGLRLAGVSLQISTGQVLALTGENGNGKSTLSKIVCCLISATQGSILLDDKAYQPTSHQAAEQLGIHMVMQELNRISTLSIAEKSLFTIFSTALWLD